MNAASSSREQGEALGGGPFPLRGGQGEIGGGPMGGGTGVGEERGSGRAVRTLAPSWGRRGGATLVAGRRADRAGIEHLDHTRPSVWLVAPGLGETVKGVFENVSGCFAR